MKTKVLLIALLVMVPACSPLQGHMDWRKHSWREVTVKDSEGLILAQYKETVPTPLLVETHWEVKYENPEKKIVFEVKVGTDAKVAGSSYTQWVTAAFSFLTGWLVGGK